MSQELIRGFAVFLSLIIAMVLHEYAHARVAYALGDPTAKNLNRLSLNPLRHIDWVMTVLLPVMLYLSGLPVFGAAKPVPVDPRYFQDPRRGMLWVAVAGPAINFVLAAMSLVGISLLAAFPHLFPESVAIEIFNFLRIFLFINVVLAVFNLIPVPPLDGSRILFGILPLRLAIPYIKLEKFGFMLVVLIIFAGLPVLVFEPLIANLNNLIKYIVIKLAM